MIIAIEATPPLPVLHGEMAGVRGGNTFEQAAAPHPNPLPISRAGKWGEGIAA
jgi:hypothetical protein